MALLLSLHICFLTHDTNRLICRLDCHWLDLTHRHTINHSSLCALILFSFDGFFMHADLLDREVARPARVRESLIDALGLSHGLVRAHNVLGRELLSRLIWDALELLVLHLARDGLLCVLRQRVILILEQLCLNRLNRIIDSVTAKRKVVLL